MATPVPQIGGSVGPSGGLIFRCTRGLAGQHQVEPLGLLQNGTTLLAQGAVACMGSRLFVEAEADPSVANTTVGATRTALALPH